jgi:hypothetical protein
LGKEVRSEKLAANSRTEDRDGVEIPESCEEICRP